MPANTSAFCPPNVPGNVSGSVPVRRGGHGRCVVFFFLFFFLGGSWHVLLDGFRKKVHLVVVLALREIPMHRGSAPTTGLNHVMRTAGLAESISHREGGEEKRNPRAHSAQALGREGGEGGREREAK